MKRSHKPIKITAKHVSNKHTHTHTHSHTHTFNGPFSGTTQVSWYQKGENNLDFTEVTAKHVSNKSKKETKND